MLFGHSAAVDVGDIEEVVESIVLVKPRAFTIFVNVQRPEVAVELDHVILQLGELALGIAPRNVRLAVIID